MHACRGPQHRGEQHVQQPRRDRQLHGAWRVPGQTFNTYTGGSLFMRSPNKVYQLAAIQFPSAKAAAAASTCSAVRSPTSRPPSSRTCCATSPRPAGHRLSAGARIGLAPAGRPDQVGQGAGDLDQQRPHQLLRDGQGHRQHGGRSATGYSSQETCADLAIEMGLESDRDAARRRCATDRTSILASARSSGDANVRNKAPFVGNLTWKALQRTGASARRCGARADHEHGRHGDLPRRGGRPRPGADRADHHLDQPVALRPGPRRRHRRDPAHAALQRLCQLRRGDAEHRPTRTRRSRRGWRP
jgi:hypothetical protein